MRNYISRRQRVQEKKNTRSALFFVFLTLSTVLILLFFGVPLVVKYVGFLTNLKRSNVEIEPDDSTPPPPPTFEYIPETTKESEIEIKGYTEPGAIVLMYINSDETEVVTDNEGVFTYKLSLTEDQYIIEALAKDNSGNTSKKVVAGKIELDKEPPTLEVARPNDKDQIFGSVNRQLGVEGKTDPDAKININGRNAIVDSNGSFSVRFSLTEGINIFNIVAEDRAGNKTEKSIEVTFSL